MDSSEALGTYEYPSTLKAFRSLVDFGLACNIQREHATCWLGKGGQSAMFPAFGFLERTRHRGHRQVVPLDRLGVLRAGQIHDRLGFGLLEIFGQGRGDLAAPPRGQAPPAIVVQFGAHFQTVRQDHVMGTQQAV